MAKIAFTCLAIIRVISHLVHAKKLVPFQTFTSGIGDDHSKFNAQFFSGIGFGTNAFLRCHTDSDFTMSILQVFLKGKRKYSVDDDVIVYFCFPTIGVAVPLCPGDYLLFNPCKPHCLSSRCKYEYYDTYNILEIQNNVCVGTGKKIIAIMGEVDCQYGGS